MLKIQTCQSKHEFSQAKIIANNYLKWLNMDLNYQKLEVEFAGIEKMYGPPKGCFLLAYYNGVLAGGVGLRYLSDYTCEMKRLFVYPQFQKQGVGKKLCELIIKNAQELGYKAMKLDTVNRLKSAIKLYEKLGFKETKAYCENPDKTARFFELKLD
ncbi:MAG: GNAT family N-acetyltransferase [Bacteroidia bacterium]